MLRLFFAGIVSLALSDSCAALYLRKPSIQWVDCASNVPQPLQNTTLPKSLPPALHCGRLNVPMDYTKPISDKNTITLGFAMNRPGYPRGLINL